MTITLHNADAFQSLPDAVLFDADNTLYPYEPSHQAGMQAVYAKAERVLGIKQEDFEKAFHMARKIIKERLHGTASSHSRLLYFQQTLEILGLRSQMLLALDLEKTYWRTFLANAQLFDHVKEFLDDLRIAGIPAAIVTDLTAQIQFRKLVYFGLDHYFDYIVSSEEAGCEKPAAAPFKLALSKLKPRGNCIWMIGDNPKNDIAGAKKEIGAVTIQKVHHGVELAEGILQADAVMKEFEGLRKLFRNIRQAPELLAVEA